VKTDTDTVRQ